MDRAERVRGAVLMQAYGDALGAPFEFSSERVDWIDRLHPYVGDVGPHGLWSVPSSPGTGTDDVRYAWVFIELACQIQRAPTAREVAQRFVEIYKDSAAFFPHYPQLARDQFSMWEGVSCGPLGLESPNYVGIPPDVLATRSVGLNYPTIAGMLALPFMGLLYVGDPERAYRAAYEAAFFDMAYAREATALLAASQSLALAGLGVREVIEHTLALDPLRLGGYFGRPFIVDNLPSLLQRARDKEGKDLAEFLSFELRHLSVFDPYRTLAIAFCALSAHADQPLRAMEVAVNQFESDGHGQWKRYADVDCYASITGGLVGALCGAGVLSDESIRQCVEGNERAYGFNLEDSAARFADVPVEVP